MPDRLHHTHVFNTAAGYCGIAWNSHGVTRFQLPTSNAAEAETLLARRLTRSAPAEPPPEIARVIDDVVHYFEGRPADFSDVRLDLDDQDHLFRDVYQSVRRIGWGQATSYGAVARDLGLGPEAARDVGQAMAKNPVPLIIPCHRVLAAGGKLGGFSAPGGTLAKRHMLELEGISVAPPKPVQQELDF